MFIRGSGRCLFVDVGRCLFVYVGRSPNVGRFSHVDSFLDVIDFHQ